MSCQSLNDYFRENKLIFTQHPTHKCLYQFYSTSPKTKHNPVSFNRSVDKETDTTIQKNPTQQ